MNNKNIKKILVLEDELSVIALFNDYATSHNEWVYQYWKWNFISIATDPSCLWRFDLSEFDAIFVDRDNALNKTGEFHTHYLELLQNSSGNLIEIVRKTYPMSGSNLNNANITNSIIKLLINTSKGDDTFYIESREDQQNIENVIKNNFLTKSFPNYKDLLNSVLGDLVISDLKLIPQPVKITQKFI